MKTQPLLRAGTLVFFFCMIAGFVAYRSGSFQFANESIPSSDQGISGNILASNTIMPIDTPPAQHTTIPDTSSASFNIMMSSKTMIIIDQSSPFSKDYQNTQEKRDSLGLLFKEIMMADSLSKLQQLDTLK